MKANAPEKIYLFENPISGTPDDRWLSKRSGDTDVEYIQTDAFIEKACDWIETNMDDYIHVEYDTVTGMPTNEAHIANKKVVEDFKNYMKGE